MARLPKFCLAAALTVLSSLSLPTWAALTYTGAGAYNIGTFAGPGGTATPSSACGNISGQDSGTFIGAGSDNIGIHAYACDDVPGNAGSRASGQGTYFAQGVASIFGTVGGTDASTFDFVVNAGQVGAFGSTAFVAGEFQRALLTIKLIIDGTTYLDEAWSAQVGAGGAITNSYVSHGLQALGWTSGSGAGYFSYDITGGTFSIPLLALPNGADHNIAYVMTSEAAGNIITTTSCVGVLAGASQSPFGAVCGAGAVTGDFNNDPIVVPTGQLPEPMTAGLVLTALLAATGVRRRAHRH
ncbi:MAG: hypothetical protein EKK53_07630 [Burkholderiales bacterium]|nr:MAG: hypothetical protein EKK53_07630 [Burkholderiales bacterium]